MEIDLKIKWKLIDVTFPSMEDKPKSLKTQKRWKTLIKLKDSSITQEFRRITHRYKLK